MIRRGTILLSVIFVFGFAMTAYGQRFLEVTKERREYISRNDDIGKLKVITKEEGVYVSKIGIIARDEKGNEEYGSILVDYEYNYPAEIRIAGKVQDGKIIVRGGQKILKYTEGVVNLANKPKDKVLNFPTKSKWLGVAAVSPDSRHLWCIKSQEGFYLESLLKDNGVYPLYLSKGVEGRIDLGKDKIPPIIFGSGYNPKEGFLILTSDGNSVKVDVTYKESPYLKPIHIGIALVILMSMIIAWQQILKKKRYKAET